ncbi:PD-(D/E)XK nuclease family protein [Planctomicrobium piriforme]|uniref:PD-(D/E)XK nuclease superfamily protein n=1 Tax=Planctomicrobium piriforme TaxID=1576369 RepID=A0A1I3F216_9PLAN|nr:PD-(D/E)XK nuclease family protein [Planctomicrobium piriforme]SFI05228.1 PD-(D/E)XK nuclease superfamily protein [Planctomicrobium piriforme]
MSRSDDNLLSVLHGWATRQDENFTTDAFAYLLRKLLLREPAIGIELVNWLTGDRLGLYPQDASGVSIRTQISTELGRPDLEIRTADALAYVEAKVESGLGDRQLHRYLEELNRDSAVTKVLVLLTRYPEEIANEIRDQVVCRRWHQVAQALEQIALPRIVDSVGAYLVEQYVEFLKERGMSIDQVTWEMTEGIRAFRNLIEMMREAVSAAGWKPVSTQGWDWIGYYINPANSSSNKEKLYYIGCNYKEPTKITFQTYQLDIVAEAAEILGRGEVLPNPYATAGLKWTDTLVIDSEEVHFFALSRERQLQKLEQFVADSIAATVRIQKVSSASAES